MLITQVLTEAPVKSSWIQDISYDEKKQSATLTVHSGRRYVIPKLPKDLYTKWLHSKSKGKFWNTQLKNKYKATRIA